MKIATVLLTMAISFFSILGTIMVAKVFGFSPSQFHDPNVVFNTSTYLTVFAILIIPIIIVLIVQKFVHKRPITDLGLKIFSLKDFFLFAIIAVFIKSAASIAAALYSPETQVSLALPTNDLILWFPYLVWFIFTLLLNSFNEELIYRAYAFENLQSKLGPLLIVILSAAVFSGMHFAIEEPSLMRFLYRLFFGTLAGFIYIRRRTLTSIVGLHTGWNLIALSVSDSDWKLGGIVHLSGLTDNSEVIANICFLSLSTVIAFFWQRQTSQDKSPAI